MPAECSDSCSDAHALEDWDVVDLKDLPCPDCLMPSNRELPHSSGSVGSRSLFSNLASRLAKAFGNNSGVHESPSLDTLDSRKGGDRRRHNSDTHAYRHLLKNNSRLLNRPSQLLVSDLCNYMDHRGCITVRSQLKRDVFERGIDASIRQMVWPILLGVYPPAMTQNERVAWMKKRSTEYHHLRSEWQNLLVDHGSFQDRSGSVASHRSRSSLYRDRTSPVCSHDTSYLRSIVTAVRKDAIRTDRTHHMFAAEDSPWTTALFNLLVTFAFAHPSIGYCQGMSDLASPLLLVMKDEASAYICFCALMVRMRRHFSPSDDSSIASKFTVLALLLRHYCPRLHRYLVSQGADDLLFAYRWLFLEMKREFPLDDCSRMLEVIWAAVPDQYLQSSSSELPLAESDYRKRAAVLTGDNMPADEEPPLFDPSGNNPTPPRRLISCATAARWGSQYYLDSLGFRTSARIISSSLLHLPVTHRTSSDCSHSAKHAMSLAHDAGEHSRNHSCHVPSHAFSHCQPARCSATDSAQTLTTLRCSGPAQPSYIDANMAFSHQLYPQHRPGMPVVLSSPTALGSQTSASLNRSSGGKRTRPLRKRRTSFPPPTSADAATEAPTQASNLLQRYTVMMPSTPEEYSSSLIPIVVNASNEADSDEGRDSAPNIPPTRVLRADSNVTEPSNVTESEAEQHGLAASSSAEYDASSEYGGDEVSSEDRSVSSLEGVNLGDLSALNVSDLVQQQQQQNNSNTSGVYGADGAETDLLDKSQSIALSDDITKSSDSSETNQTMSPPTSQPPQPSLLSTPLLPPVTINVSEQTPAQGTDANPLSLVSCSTGEDAERLLANTSEVMDDSCEIATEAIMSPQLVATEAQQQVPSVGLMTELGSQPYCYDSGVLTAGSSELVTSEDEDAELPNIHELGDSPFVVFVALTLLLQHRSKLLEGRMDYNEIHIYFDKLVRRHDAEAVLQEARRLYNAFLNGKHAGSGGSSSTQSRFSIFGGGRRSSKSSASSKQHRSMPAFVNETAKVPSAVARNSTDSVPISLKASTKSSSKGSSPSKSQQSSPKTVALVNCYR